MMTQGRFQEEPKSIKNKKIIISIIYGSSLIPHGQDIKRRGRTSGKSGGKSGLGVWGAMLF